MLNNRKDKIWLCKTADGKKLFEQYYKEGKFRKLVRFVNGSGTMTRSVEAQNVLMQHFKFDVTERFELAKGFYRFPSSFMKIYFPTPAILMSISESTVFLVVEKPPLPKGGLQTLFAFIDKNLQYPLTARRNRIQGSVYVSFVIDIDGSLDQLQVINGLNEECDNEALRIVAESQKEIPWTPGSHKGRLVKVRFTLPVKFRLH